MYITKNLDMHKNTKVYVNQLRFSCHSQDSTHKIKDSLPIFKKDSNKIIKKRFNNRNERKGGRL